MDNFLSVVSSLFNVEIQLDAILTISQVLFTALLAVIVAYHLDRAKKQSLKAEAIKITEKPRDQ